jgi:hypothetical protein
LGIVLNQIGESNMQAWQIESNIEVLGYYETAKILKRKGYSLEQALAMIFGKRS